MDDVSSDCLRCGYDLRGIADDQPCPECGLLAERSRRKTEALRDARPRWLLSLSAGVWVILLAFGGLVFCPFLAELIRAWTWPLRRTAPWTNVAHSLVEAVISFGPFLIPAAMLVLGAFLLTRPEGYEPADLADRSRRRWIRRLSFGGLVGVGLMIAGWAVEYRSLWGGWAPVRRGIEPLFTAGLAVLTLAMIPLAALGFEQLRSLARRAGSAHLREHCRIVGTGLAITLLILFPVALVAKFSEALGIDYNTTARSSVWMGTWVLVFTAVILFWLWTIYVMVRFAVSFGRASKENRRMLQNADLSVEG